MVKFWCDWDIWILGFENEQKTIFVETMSYIELLSVWIRFVTTFFWKSKESFYIIVIVFSQPDGIFDLFAFHHDYVGNTQMCCWSPSNDTELDQLNMRTSPFGREGMGGLWGLSQHTSICRGFKGCFWQLPLLQTPIICVNV